MNESQEQSLEAYPHGRGYGHDYMRGGEVMGGYGYSERDQYETRRGELESAPTMYASTAGSDHQNSHRS